MMDNIRNLERDDKTIERLKARLQDGGEPPTMDPMEARLSEVEKAIVRIDAVLPTLATKGELASGFGDMVKWIVGTAFAGLAALIVVMTFVLNNAVPKAPPTATQAPIVIYAPSPQASH